AGDPLGAEDLAEVWPERVGRATVGDQQDGRRVRRRERDRRLATIERRERQQEGDDEEGQPRDQPARGHAPPEARGLHASLALLTDWRAGSHGRLSATVVVV